jgi:DNA-binding NarL/FixJ family response regulator
LNQPIRVVVIDDHPLFREGVARSLQETGDFAIVGQGGTADDAVRLVREHEPEVVLLDLSMPGGGLDAARRIGQNTSGTTIVVLTASEADDDIMAALRAGAKGYVLKGVGSATLNEVVRGGGKGRELRFALLSRSPPQRNAHARDEGAAAGCAIGPD